MAIRVEDLSFGYGAATVLDRVSLEIEPGRFTVILGRKGSGKSTLFKVLAGTVRPCRGRVFLAEFPDHHILEQVFDMPLTHIPHPANPMVMPA